MGILSISYSSNLITKLIKVPENNNWYIPTRRKTTTNVVVFCHQGGGGSSGNVIKSSNMSSVLSSLVSSDHAATTLMDAGSLVLSPNGKTQGDIVVKDMVPYGGTTSTTTLINGLEDDGIGIVKFLRGKKFFVTGATGFLAKVLIEKILRTEPEVGKMYLLIKAKNKQAAMERLHNEIINTELFRSLRQIHGKSYQSFMLSKLVPIVGDICETNLGLDEDLSNVIEDEVDVIVNSAANTTFDER
ncbi:fatty acyl-CoA reductase 2-like protein [Trifolium pratense]|uniref:Fatty acyl-CoA reductase n=3 Tax=Trifolium pratense TaxID=57577 RepID=A0A2K3LBW1_TRIPR|nr:fatty acyl-CoA reductase 2-like protein [Trifolium pratense]